VDTLHEPLLVLDTDLTVRCGSASTPAPEEGALGEAS